MTRRRGTFKHAITILSISFGLVITGLGWADASPRPAGPDPADTVSAPPSVAPATDQAGVDTDIVIPAGAAPAAGALSPSAPMTPGQVVSHTFDVVEAHIYPTRADIPATTWPQKVPVSATADVLNRSAQWWSDHTDLSFSFTVGRLATVSSTCDDYRADAAAAVGVPGGLSYYAKEGHDLLIWMTGLRCGMFAGQGSTSATGNVSAGGVISQQNEDLAAIAAATEGVSVTTTHEFGHTIGLLHANMLDCQTVPLTDDRVGPLWDGYAQAACASTEYGDHSSIMGTEHTPEQTLNSLQRWFLGVGGPDTVVIDRPVTRQVVTLRLYDDGTAASARGSGIPRGVVVSTPGGGFAGSLELRDPSPLRYGRPGVYVTVGVSDGGGLQTDFAGAEFVPLGPGETYVSQDGTARLRTLSVDATTARVEVTVADQPGIPGMVSITRAGGTLKAVVTGSTTSVASTYQWFRNGAAIPGATGATYTPALPDPNAVYRVEATQRAAGHAATTRYSRGIVADDRRLGYNGTELTMTLLDESGGALDCAVTSLVLSIATAAGVPVTTQQAQFRGTTVPGVCTSAMSIPITGDMMITGTMNAPSQGDNAWRAAYWGSVTSPVSLTTTRATAGLMIGVVPAAVPNSLANNTFAPWGGSLVPQLYSGNGNPPLSVTVSVTDSTGAPAAGVRVKLTASVPGLVFSDASPVTDRDGFAHASVEWDHAAYQPDTIVTETVTAVVEGFDVVAGSPARLKVAPAGPRQIAGWFEGKTSLLGDGKDTATLRVRVWDATGAPIEDQASRLDIRAMAWMSVVTAAQVTAPAWDPVDQSYVVKVTSTTAELIYLIVTLDASSTQYMLPIEFQLGVPNVRVSFTYGSLVVSDACTAAYDPPRLKTRAVVVVTSATGVAMPGVVVEWSAEAPLWLGTARSVTAASGTAAIDVDLDLAKWAGAGRVEAEVRATVGGVTGRSFVTVAPGQIPWWDKVTSATLSVAPTSATPVLADGTSSWTASARVVDQCGGPMPSQSVSFSADGSAVLSAVSGVTDADGWVRVTVTDRVAETVNVSAWLGAMPIIYPALTGSPAAVKFEAKPVVKPVVKTVTVALSDPLSLFEVTRQPCGGAVSVSPERMVATATVRDAAGQPVPGALVTWGTNYSVHTGSATSLTGDDGRAEVALWLDTAEWWDGLTGMSLSATVDGIRDVAPVYATRTSPQLPSTDWTISYSPSGVVSVPADGQAAWRIAVHTVDQCGFAIPYQVVRFSVDGNARLAYGSTLSNGSGWAYVTVTDAQPEAVRVSVTGWAANPAGPYRVDLRFGP